MKNNINITSGLFATTTLFFILVAPMFGVATAYRDIIYNPAVMDVKQTTEPLSCAGDKKSGSGNDKTTLEHNNIYSPEGSGNFLIDLGLFNTTCNKFEVKLRPDADVTNNYITNVQFTIKWKSGLVNLIDFDSDFDVELQGQVVTENDTNYAVFATATAYPVNWTSENEYTILTFAHDQSGTGYTDFLVDNWNWAIANNGVYYVELLGLDHTGVVYLNALNAYTGPCGELDLRVFLEGPFDPVTGQMKTLLNETGNIPLDKPYSGVPWNYEGNETLIDIPADMVDWILLELRDAPDAESAAQATTFDKQSVLLMKDGTVTGLDGISMIRFDNASVQKLFVVIRHRNHLDIISADQIITTDGLTYHYDFTASASQAYQNGQNLLNGNVYGMIAGDGVPDGIVNADDRLQAWKPYAGTTGYRSGDFNLDGQVNNPDKNDLWFKNINKSSQVPE
jgi:hypothetical protein